MKKLFLIVLIILTGGCAREEKKPDQLMTQQQMINFLIDLHIVEARLNATRLPPDSINLFFSDIEDSLFRKYNVTDSIYYKSYQYYLENIFEMEKIYEAVVDSLSIRERMLKAN